MKVLFYARVKDKKLFNDIEFYANDIMILQDLGYDVVLANTVKDLFVHKVDFYYCWWFGYSILPLMFSILRNKKIVVTGNVHTVDCKGLKGWPKHKNIIMKIVMRFSDANIFTSKVEVNRLNGFKANNPHMLYHCVDNRNYNYSKNSPRDNCIITITQFTLQNIKRKKVLDNILAFKMVLDYCPDAHYYLCGSDGDGVELIDDFIKEHGLIGNVTIIKNITKAEKINLLQSSKVYLQQTGCEGFGLAILEAQACGLPVVTSTDPVLKEVYGDSVIYIDNNIEISKEIIKSFNDAAYLLERISKSAMNAENFYMESRKNKVRHVLDTCGCGDGAR